jgi:hypothetical protein
MGPQEHFLRGVRSEIAIAEQAQLQVEVAVRVTVDELAHAGLAPLAGEKDALPITECPIVLRTRDVLRFVRHRGVVPLQGFRDESFWRHLAIKFG